MLLRLYPEDLTKPIDFREGRWGHRLHASTFRGLRSHKVRRWPLLPWPLIDEPESVRRVSFMVHTSDTPAIGREVIWAAAGGVRTGRIYDVEHCGNPRDMMTLFVVIDDACRQAAVSTAEQPGTSAASEPKVVPPQEGEGR